MTVKCPVTNKDCPYLQKLDSDVCPREHECDAVKDSYSKIGRKPPSPKKILVVLFSILILAAAVVFASYYFILNGNLFSENAGNQSQNATPPPVSASETPSPEATPEPTPAPGLAVDNTATPTSVPTPPPGTLPPVPVTSGPAENPVRIEINDVISEIQKVPLDENQNIAVLPSARIISWYEGSYLPGETGNCILFGYKHYGGFSGAFFSLEKLQAGDTIKFTLDNGSVVEQKVFDTIVYREGYLPEDVLALENDTPRTVIISETGDVNPDTGGYMDLIVVYTQ